eukprot:scaffold122763_cov33-Tisochrysis_lutea.AAC.2
MPFNLVDQEDDELGCDSTPLRHAQSINSVQPISRVGALTQAPPKSMLEIRHGHRFFCMFCSASGRAAVCTSVRARHRHSSPLRSRVCWGDGLGTHARSAPIALGRGTAVEFQRK